ncbi:MAG: Sua5/YciO/YrdC/YwlC family protein [Actinomycetota bacterium]|nr:Sua5/YciO/YrdC/YwlC family protein [Actinomycetota bacterium]MDQ3568998.1 Sua5/YciO/YrdC/YwlC family protein [Actinomycetota bacterium]
MNTTSVMEAADALRAGKVILVPTETVVGLVASKAGLSRIQEIKHRDSNKAVALICSSPEEAFGIARNVPPLAEKLAEIYWPGPLTLVLDAPGGGTVGVRVPDHPAVQKLLAAFGGPLYATSANVSGEPAPASLDDVDLRVSGEVDWILAGEPGSGEASAVVDLSGGKIELLRASPQLTEERLRRLDEDLER